VQIFEKLLAGCIFADMNKNQTSLLVLGTAVAGFLVYSLFRKGRTLKNLNFGIKGIDIDKKKKVVSVDFRLINPTKVPITVNSIVCDLVLQNEAVGTLRYLKDIAIAAQAETVIRIPVTINPISIISLFTTLLTSKNNQIEFTIKGVVGAENIFFPVNVTSNYDLNIFKKQTA
jgi:LEA14-like dessication related protein